MAESQVWPEWGEGKSEQGDDGSGVGRLGMPSANPLPGPDPTARINVDLHSSELTHYGCWGLPREKGTNVPNLPAGCGITHVGTNALPYRELG